jgi:Arc/MetJ-type ribon-helix-helix transcriptional regulator
VLKDQVDNTTRITELDMTTIMPQSELVKKAVAYIQERRREESQDMRKLIDQAGMRFNLSPKEAEMLRDFFKQSESDH